MKALGIRGDFTSRVFRCFRASEFIFRRKEWDVITDAKKNTDDDVAPDNPLQHTKLRTTLDYYANMESRATRSAK